MTENQIEQLAIDLLKQQGFVYLNGTDIAPDSSRSERSSFEEVLLKERIAEAVKRINSTVPPAAQEEAIKEIQRIHSPELLTNNESFHRLLTEGVKVSYQKDGQQRGDLVWLVDFNTPENNDFVVANQFTVIENNVNKRPDLILFVNGIPLVVMELKNPVDENATIKSAFRQIETYKSVIPSLFTYNAFIIISDGLEARAGTLSSGMSRFMAWKSVDGQVEASALVSQLETLIKVMLNPTTLLDLVRHFVVFEKSRKEDKDGIVTVHTVKKLAAYHQYYAVNRAVESTLRATGYSPKFPSAGGVAESQGGRNSSNYFSLPYNPALKERARALRQAGNLSEVLFWNEVKNKQFKGFDFDRQKIIGNYIVDFYCTNCNVVIEIDGSSHDDKVEYDATRDAYLEPLGLTVIHISAKDVLQNLAQTMDWLYEHPALSNDLEPPPPYYGHPSKGGEFNKGVT